MTLGAAILFLLAGVFACVVIDLDNVFKSHFKRWFTKAGVCMSSVTLFTWASSAYWLTALSTSVALCVTWFFVLFNGFYNIGRGKPWWFAGTPDENDSIAEQVQRSMPLWCWILINGLVLAFGNVVYWGNY